MCSFPEKYPPVVRVVPVPGSSTELCSGTHAASTGEIRPFKITGQTSVALGIRRIEAVAAEAADQWYDGQYQYLSSLGRTLEVAPVKIEERVKRLLARERELEKEVGVLQRKLASSAANSSASQSLAGTYSGHPLAVHVYPVRHDTTRHTPAGSP
jgi:alanyl-tRNA synthetase